MIYTTKCLKRNNIIKISLNTHKKRVVKTLFDENNRLIYQDLTYENSKYNASLMYLNSIQNYVNMGYTITS